MSPTPPKMLVADDSRVVHHIFRQAASKLSESFQIVAAYDGRQCSEMLERGDIDLAFIDINMPEMSGMQALAAARDHGVSTFVTLMSTDASAPRIELARQLRVYEFLQKPFALHDVEAIMTTYLRVTAPTRALVVDDSSTVRKVMQRVLSASIFNVEIEEACDGETALACCDGGDFDVVFLDCNMPGLNGIDTLHLLRQRNSGVKVIMISREQNEHRVQAALAAGATVFLHKPFYPADIDRALHMAFSLRPVELTAA
jgi:CheY-like chemotaxis protein